GWFGGMSTVFFSVMLGGVGSYLIRYHTLNRKQLWASIVGFTLLGVALAAIGGDLAGFYFLGMLALGFVMVYIRQRKHWWAVIPGGVLLTLSFIVALEELLPRWDEGTFFFAGLAATFAYLFTYERQRWAIFPALALLFVGLLNLSFAGGWVFPALLIAAGVYALYRQKLESSDTPVAATTTPTALVKTEPVVLDSTLEPTTVDDAMAAKEVYARTLEVRAKQDEEK
ncbi:MAG: hypothetical protein ACRCYY_11960, partial [Trueperaceae bacterium]